MRLVLKAAVLGAVADVGRALACLVPMASVRALVRRDRRQLSKARRVTLRWETVVDVTTDRDPPEAVPHPCPRTDPKKGCSLCVVTTAGRPHLTFVRAFCRRGRWQQRIALPVRWTTFLC